MIDLKIVIEWVFNDFEFFYSIQNAGPMKKLKAGDKFKLEWSKQPALQTLKKKHR